jgi:regulator of sigma E protease
MDILIKALQLILSLSILVIVHEFGHFLAARLFKVRVEKFYLFFNPWFSVFRFKKGETEYGLGWLPLGGYVKIAGMIDESLDKEQLKRPPQPWEFRSKPAWQRLIIMLGGVLVNVILAIIIYIGMLVTWGEQYLPTSELRYGITTDTLAREMGLRNGDKILTVDNVAVEDFIRIPERIILNDAKSIQVIRNGQKVDLGVPQGFIGKLIKQGKAEFISVRIPFVVGDFVKGSTGREAGIQVDDKIIALNGKPTVYFDEFFDELQKHKNEEIVVTVLRGADSVSLTARVPPEGKLGIYPKPLTHFFTLREKDYSLFQAIPASFSKTYNGVANYLKQLKLLFRPEVKAYESVGGFITIGNIFPADWEWEIFWRLTAFLSIMLAILNVLPIPALDGGHVMFLLYEIITRRKPSDKFLEYAQIVGMVLLFALLIFANGNDIIKLFR